MQGSIIQRGKSISIVIDIGKDPETGKRKQKWFSGYKTKKAAEKDLPRILMKVESGELVKSNKITVKDFFSEWLNSHTEKNNLAATTVAGYENIIHKHFDKYFEDKKLQDLKVYDVQKYFDEKHKTLSAKTLTQHYRVMHRAFSYAKRMQLIEIVLCNDIERPKEIKTETEVLTIEQSIELLNAINGHWYLGVPVTLALKLGLRRGECLGLSWTDIDYINKTITINKSLTKAKDKLIFKEPKTLKSKRTIAITDDIIELFKAHKKLQNKLQIACSDWKNERDLVCTRRDGTPITPNVLSNTFNGFLRSNKFPIIRFHDLRHTNATLMLAAGVSAKVAGNRLGHASIKTTLDLYSHVLETVDRDAAERLQITLSK